MRLALQAQNDDASKRNEVKPTIILPNFTLALLA
jgi:hypothetical protein